MVLRLLVVGNLPSHNPAGRNLSLSLSLRSTMSSSLRASFILYRATTGASSVVRSSTTRQQQQHGLLRPFAGRQFVLNDANRMMIQRQYASSALVATLEDETKSNLDDNKTPKSRQTRKRRRDFVPRKAAVQLTEQARQAFQQLLQDPPRPDIIGIQLLYQQSSTGQPRMVFSFRFVTAADVSSKDEAVSLQLLQDGKTPKPPAEAATDGLPKLYVAADAFLKVLGATVDVDLHNFTPVLYDKEGNVMDPNA